MNALSFFGYAIALAISPVIGIVMSRWIRSAWYAALALGVLSRERRTGESLYDTAEALSGDAHNWRGMTGEITDPQPAPQNQDGLALWPLVISELGSHPTDRLVAVDMQQRHEFGVAKYGVPLVASNGRDHLADAYQEALDGVVYLRAEIENSLNKHVDETDTTALTVLHQLYVDMLDAAKEIRELIRRRDGQ